MENSQHKRMCGRLFFMFVSFGSIEGNLAAARLQTWWDQFYRNMLLCSENRNVQNHISGVQVRQCDTILSTGRKQGVRCFLVCLVFNDTPEQSCHRVWLIDVSCGYRPWWHVCRASAATKRIFVDLFIRCSVTTDKKLHIQPQTHAGDRWLSETEHPSREVGKSLALLLILLERSRSQSQLTSGKRRGQPGLDACQSQAWQRDR